MKRAHLHETYPPKAVESATWHLSMIGKPADPKVAKQLLDAIVKDNPNFHPDLDIEDTVHAFFSALHYGSHELKNATLSAHTRSMSAFLEARSATHPRHDPQSTCPPKPDHWQYDPQAPLPKDITPEKAKHLLYAIAEWRGNRPISEWRNSTGFPISGTSAQNWQHYINKLKDRAQRRA